jgi:phosphoribosylanthranilate isomerase
VTWIKICGTTNLEDALLAAEAGADALGFIFAESPRRITPELARSIIAQLPGEIENVGVFVNSSVEDLCEVVKGTGITRIQLQGDEDADFVRTVKEKLPSLPIAKALRVDERLRESLGALNGSALVDCIVLDSGSVAQRGGTGRIFDWQMAQDAIAQSGIHLHLIIAGGLNAGNVGEALRIFRPWGVDVVSGVESCPGKKDASKIREFIAAAQAVEGKH